MDKTLKRQLGLVFGFVFIDLLGYSLILPLLPYYAEAFGASLTVVGLLGTSNALAQLVAAPFIGRLSDRFGRRPMLIFSITGTVLSFTILGLAQSVPVLFLSRVLDGLLGGNIALARAYITDITDEDNRSRGLGIIGAAFGLGFIIGPAMGGFLSRYGFAAPAFLAAGLSLLNLIAVVLWLPESLTPERRRKAKDQPRPSLSPKAFVAALRRPCAGPLLHVQLFYNLAFTLFTANFAIFSKERLGLSVQSTSFVLAYVGLLSVLVQGLAVGRLTDRYRERTLIAAGIVGLGGFLVLWGFTPSVWLLLVVLAPIALASGVLNVVLSSQLTKAVYREEVGGTLGLSASLQTLAQIVAPGLGGLLSDSLGPWTIGVLGGLIMLWTYSFARRRVISVPESEMVSCRAPSMGAASS